MVKGRLKISRLIAVWFILTAVSNILLQYVHVNHTTTISYTALTLFWIVSIGWEIVEPHIRRSLRLGGVMVFMLFVLRFIKYNLVEAYTLEYRLLWYAYYIPIITLPLLSFAASINIGKKDVEKNRRIMLPLAAACVLLCIAFMTNDIHGMAIKIWYTDGEQHNSMQPVYYIVMAWYVVLGLTAFIIMIQRCRVSSYKKYLKYPVIIESIGILLWAWYYINKGSSPKFMGVSLFNIQEVFLLQFIGLWEGCIVAGLIPSRSLMMERDWIRKNILDSIYDEYVSAKEKYEELWKKDEDQFREGLIRIACLGAYAKRRANLELIADSRGNLSTVELALAIRESFEYYQLAGIATGYEETGKASVPALLVIYAYELFEKIIEKAQSACYVKVQTGQTKDSVSFRMIIETDLNSDENGETVINAVKEDMGDPEVLGAAMTVKDEDETDTIEISAVYPVRGSLTDHFKDKGRAAEHGLAGVAEFLSIEDEALKVKTWIHDSLGRCLLMTKRYILSPGDVERDALYREWNRTFAGISEEVGKRYGMVDTVKAPEADDVGGSYPADSVRELYRECFDQAGSMGVKVIFKGTMPQDPRYLGLIDTAITVHVTNVSEHTTGNEVYITAKESDEAYIFVFKDNGGPLGHKINETGGLKNLRRQTEAAGGSMEIASEPLFCMTLTFMR